MGESERGFGLEVMYFEATFDQHTFSYRRLCVRSNIIRE